MSATQQLLCFYLFCRSLITDCHEVRVILLYGASLALKLIATGLQG